MWIQLWSSADGADVVRLLAELCLPEKGFGKSAFPFCQAVSYSINKMPFWSDLHSMQTYGHDYARYFVKWVSTCAKHHSLFVESLCFHLCGVVLQVRQYRSICKVPSVLDFHVEMGLNGSMFRAECRLPWKRWKSSFLNTNKGITLFRVTEQCFFLNLVKSNQNLFTHY